MTIIPHSIEDLWYRLSNLIEACTHLGPECRNGKEVAVLMHYLLSFGGRYFTDPTVSKFRCISFDDLNAEFIQSSNVHTILLNWMHPDSYMAYPTKIQYSNETNSIHLFWDMCRANELPCYVHVNAQNEVNQCSWSQFNMPENTANHNTNPPGMLCWTKSGRSERWGANGNLHRFNAPAIKEYDNNDVIVNQRHFLYGNPVSLPKYVKWAKDNNIYDLTNMSEYELVLFKLRFGQ